MKTYYFRSFQKLKLVHTAWGEVILCFHMTQITYLPLPISGCRTLFCELSFKVLLFPLNKTKGLLSLSCYPLELDGKVLLLNTTQTVPQNTDNQAITGVEASSLVASFHITGRKKLCKKLREKKTSKFHRTKYIPHIVT